MEKDNSGFLDNGVVGEEEILLSSKQLDKDERMLPIHFLPEGQKCYDWINEDLAKDEERQKEIHNLAAETTCEDGVKYFESGEVDTEPMWCDCPIKKGNGNDKNDVCIPKICPICGKNLVNKKQIVSNFLEAAEYGRVDVLKHLLNVMANIVEEKDEDGYTALHRASYNGHLETVSFLIENCGADVASKTIDGWEPLHCACRWNQLEVAELLLAKGASINAQTNGGLSPLHLAATAPDRIALLEMLLLDNRIDPNLQNNARETAYHVAFRSGQHYKLFELVDDSLNMKHP